MKKATIITIGDELLLGQVVDTNSAFMARELSQAGIEVQRRIAIGDVADTMLQTLQQETAQADYVFITGGLGPTSDDITKPVICRLLQTELKQDDAVLAHLQQLFEQHLKRELTPRNMLQAMVPVGCEALHNAIGTAPGLLFKYAAATCFALPGVPQEMETLMLHQVLPRIKSIGTDDVIEHRTLVTFGIGESTIADRLVDFEAALPNHIGLAYLPNYGLLRLRLTARGNIAGLNDQFIKLQSYLSDCLISTKDQTMQQIVADVLTAKNKTLSTAESCTGGYISHLLTSIPGSSAWFEGSGISYSYRAKEVLFAVQPATLTQYGAVSQEVVQQMAAGAINTFKTDFAIAVSGIMGPGGGMPGKPVGMVWVAVGNDKKIICKKFQFRFNRKKNIELTAMHALNLLRSFIAEGG